MSARQLALRLAADVRPRAVAWAWDGRIPLGALTLLAGREGLGKSTAAVELVARLTRGELDGDLLGAPAQTIYASAEDSAEATLVPRLLAAGADLARVNLLEVTIGQEARSPDSLTLPQDTAALREVAKRARARLLVLDPLVSYLRSDVNAHRDQHVRRVLAPLAQLATDLDLGLVAIVHLNKGETTDVLARVGGSVGFTAAARSVLVFGRDPDDPAGENGPRRVLAHAKCNVARQAPSLLARIEPRLVDGDPPIPTSRLVILGDSEQTARDLIAQPASAEERSARDDAADFLRVELADGPVPVKTLQAAAETAGISWRTLERAKRSATVRSRKTADGWTWELNPASVTPRGGLGGLGGVAEERPPRPPTSPAREEVAETNGHHADLDPDAELARLAAKGLIP